MMSPPRQRKSPQASFTRFTFPLVSSPTLAFQGFDGFDGLVLRVVPRPQGALAPPALCKALLLSFLSCRLGKCVLPDLHRVLPFTFVSTYSEPAEGVLLSGFFLLVAMLPPLSCPIPPLFWLLRFMVDFDSPTGRGDFPLSVSLVVVLPSAPVFLRVFLPLSSCLLHGFCLSFPRGCRDTRGRFHCRGPSALCPLLLASSLLPVL